MQLIGRPWGEASLLRVAFAIEVSVLIILLNERKWIVHAMSNLLKKKVLVTDLKYSSFFQELCAKSRKKPATFYDVLKTN